MPKKEKMKLYHLLGYPDQKTDAGIGVVELLTRPVASCLWRGYYDTEMKRHETELFGVNYGDMNADGAPFRKGFEFEAITYEIDTNKKVLVAQKQMYALFYDADKIPVAGQFVFEGRLEAVLKEFEEVGFKLKVA